MDPQRKSNISVCKDCLVEAVCIKPCENFEQPPSGDIFYYLENEVRLERLRVFHLENRTDGIYDLSKNLRLFLTSNGSKIKYDKRKNMYYLIEDDEVIFSFYSSQVKRYEQ